MLEKNLKKKEQNSGINHHNPNPIVRVTKPTDLQWLIGHLSEVCQVISAEEKRASVNFTHHNTSWWKHCHKGEGTKRANNPPLCCTTYTCI